MMRTLTLWAAVFVWSLVYSAPAQGQQEYDMDELPVLALMKDKKDKGAYGSFKEEERGKTALIYRHHKQLPTGFTGYVIELIHSEVPLQRKNEMFKHFGNVVYDKLEDGSYSYCFVIDFGKKKSMETFLQKVVRPKVTEARIIQYKKGIRKPK